jgi:hypothetical protein
VTRLLIYASPVDHHRPADWYGYRDRIHETLARAGAAGAVSVDDDPLFTYGVAPESVLARVNAMQPGRSEIVLAQWSTIVFYSASVLVLGEGVDPHVVRSALRSEPFLKEHVGAYTLLSGTCYVYDLFPYDENDRPATRRIVERVPNRVYVGASWIVNDEEGVVDEARFEILGRVALGENRSPEAIVAFRPRVADDEEEIWTRARQGDGLALLSEDDPRLPVVLTSPDVDNELPLFMGADEDGRIRPRVTIGRCHMDDAFVCLYNHESPSNEGLRLLV